MPGRLPCHARTLSVSYPDDWRVMRGRSDQSQGTSKSLSISDRRRKYPATPKKLSTATPDWPRLPPTPPDLSRERGGGGFGLRPHLRAPGAAPLMGDWHPTLVSPELTSTAACWLAPWRQGSTWRALPPASSALRCPAPHRHVVMRSGRASPVGAVTGCRLYPLLARRLRASAAALVRPSLPTERTCFPCALQRWWLAGAVPGVPGMPGGRSVRAEAR